MLGKASQFLHRGLKPDAHDIVHLIRDCTKSGLFSHGEQIHCRALKSGLNSNVFVSSALVNFYMKFEHLQIAHQLFAENSDHNVVSWNSLISGYVHSGQFRKALILFLQLEKSNLYADSYSFSTALSACGQLSFVHLGKSLHSKIVKYGLDCSVFVSNCLIDMYGKCGLVEDSLLIFERMIKKDTISWNTAIAANARNGKLEQALTIFQQMPNPDTISYNELTSSIARYGIIEDAVAILSTMPNPNSSSWNSIVTGYVNRGRNKEALEIFYNMHLNCVRMDQFTFSSILSGIASLAAVTWGNLIHCCIIKQNLEKNVVVGSALVDMYFKCGKIEEAESLFRSMPDKNLVTWNTVISGYAHNGDYNKVIQLFELLKRTQNVNPDEITFLNVLSACWHNRIPLKVASRYFEMMNEYGVLPTQEHCTLMIRLLGQEGEVEKAKKMIDELGFSSFVVVWNALLSACVVCGNVKVAEVASKKIRELGGNDEFMYVMMSNIYARHGKWEDVGGVRETMRIRKMKKEAGFSWIQGSFVEL